MKKQYLLNVREFGKQNEKIIVLIHPSIVTWDYFEYIIPLLEKEYRLIIPTIPGYDFSNESEFTSVEEIAVQIGDYLKTNHIDEVNTVYGCSMGGSIALRMTIDKIIRIQNLVMDGGITPYQFPWIITRLILLRDFVMIAIGKMGGEKILLKAFHSDHYDKESLKYIANMLKHMTYKTIWKTFDSCNNYKMPKSVMHPEAAIYYWCAEHELKERDWDIKYMQKFIPDTQLVVIEGIGHGALALLKPKRFASEIIKVVSKNSSNLTEGP